MYETKNMKFFIMMNILLCLRYDAYKIDMEYILGMDVNTFIDYYKQKIPIVIHRHNDEFHYDKLHCGNDIDVDHFYTCHKYNDDDRFRVVIANSEQSIKLTKYKEAWFEHFKNGFSILLNGIDCPHVQELFRKTFEKHVNINMYMTPPYSQALSRHNDTMDVFILQIKGTKHWFLYEGDDCIIHHVILKSGSMMYLPSGITHEAKTYEQESHHITIGIHH